MREIKSSERGRVMRRRSSEPSFLFLNILHPGNLQRWINVWLENSPLLLNSAQPEFKALCIIVSSLSTQRIQFDHPLNPVPLLLLSKFINTTTQKTLSPGSVQILISPLRSVHYVYNCPVSLLADFACSSEQNSDAAGFLIEGRFRRLSSSTALFQQN